jgi:hypothetical protein
MLKDTIGDNRYTPVAKGTTITLRVSINDYNYNAPNGEYISFYAKVDSEGRYSFDIPSTNNGITVSLIGGGFEHDYQDFMKVDEVWLPNGIKPSYYQTKTTTVYDVIIDGYYVNNIKYTRYDLK